MNTAIIQESVNILKSGGLILYPTDTVWGIGCDATNEKAVEKIYALKQRADSKSLIVVVDALTMLERYVQQVPEMAYSLIEVSDQPLTIIYPKAAGLAPNAVAEDGSIAIRIVDHDFCTALLRAFKKPIISTSANISGENTPAKFEAISDAIKQGVNLVIPQEWEKGATQTPSSIIKIGMHGEIQIIRK